METKQIIRQEISKELVDFLSNLAESARLAVRMGDRQVSWCLSRWVPSSSNSHNDYLTLDMDDNDNDNIYSVVKQQDIRDAFLVWDYLNP